MSPQGAIETPESDGWSRAMPPRWQRGEGERRQSMERGGQRNPRSLRSRFPAPHPRGGPGARAVRPRSPIAASAGGLAPLPAPARTVTATEFMNLSEWKKKKAGSLYHIQRKLSFKRKFSVITLKGAILTQSVTTLTCC